MSFLTSLYSAFLPFLLLPIEILFPYPHFVEEVAKFLVIKYAGTEKFSFAVLVFSGLAFSFTETILYSFNIVKVGGASAFLTRFLYTSALHSATFIIIGYFLYSKKFPKVTGLIISIIIHFLYNQNIGSII